jgi:hypothetical protein
MMSAACLYLLFTACIMLASPPTHALDSSDLLFYLSFEDGVYPELARGSADPAEMPEQLEQRIVEGIIGKAYLFGGKKSGIAYYTGYKGGPRACDEMYGEKNNLFGDSGTVAFWIKGLPNSHNMAHPFFRMWPLQIVRNQYMHHQYHYSQKGGYFYDADFKQNPWIHFALTWQKDEARAYYNGHLMSVTPECGVIHPTPEKFEVAAEGMTWLDFQKKEFEDDAVIDEVQIFRRPLADEEIRALFERGHTTTKQQVGNIPDKLVTKPERAYAGHNFVAPVVGMPVKPDGNLAEWKHIPGHGAFIERQVGVVDYFDPGVVYATCDADNLYLAFYSPVHDIISKDPTHIWYPQGQFLTRALPRDADIHGDDYVQFNIGSKDGRTYRFIFNASNTLVDSRDFDRTWNAQQIVWSSHADFNAWIIEAAIPLKEIGVTVGDTVDFNVLRSWKLFSSSQNALCADERSQPSPGKLSLRPSASASVASLGDAANGELTVYGSIIGPAGAYTVKLKAQGFGQSFEKEATITVEKGLHTFAVPYRLEQPGDIGLVVEILDPEGNGILNRSLPFVFVAPSVMELVNYPGWGKLEVTVKPLRPAELHAVVTLNKEGKTLETHEIQAFDDPAETVAFETKSLPVGKYEICARLFRGKDVVSEDRQPFEKEPLPEWYHNTAGVIDGPPIPWTDVQVNGNTVKLLLKDITCDPQLLFPRQIVTNGQSLFAGPVRLRLTHNGEEKVITAGSMKLTEHTRRKASWVSTAQDGNLQIRINGWIEFDGLTYMTLTLSGDQVDALTVEIPLDRKTVTMKNMAGMSPIGDKAIETVYGTYWFGNEQGGFSYFWDDQRGWELAGTHPAEMVPGPDEVTIKLKVIQKPVQLAKPRSLSFGWTATPSKPVRTDRRTLSLYRGISYTAGDYTYATPNYPKPTGKPEDYEHMARTMNRPDGPITCWYAFGPYQWIGSPEYAEWWREWRNIPSDLAKPDPNSTAWGPACHNSSASDLQIWLLDQFIKNYPQRAIYFDCMGNPHCKNLAHGCGYIDDQGILRETGTMLATRRHYERIYNLIKAADPKDGWVRFHDWGPNPVIVPFCDENWLGEGLIGPLRGTPEKNYYRILDMHTCRIWLTPWLWGHESSFLTEMASAYGDTPELRAGWYGRMLTPPKDGQHGEWDLPRWSDYEHVAGLGMIHDMWQIGGNDLQLAWMWMQEVCRMMRWDDHVRFLGYWQLGDALTVEGGAPEQIVCSVYYRPSGLPVPIVPEMRQQDRITTYRNFIVGEEVKQTLRELGESNDGWLVLVPMNNSDQDVTLTLKPNLGKLGFQKLANSTLIDLFRISNFSWQGPPGWYANAGDPEPPYITVNLQAASFTMRNGVAQITVPKRSFRALLLTP